MISKICAEKNNSDILFTAGQYNSKAISTPSFKGGVWPLVLQGIQECEKNPMINVTVIDMLSAILPRTVIESLTNWFAGFEAFRRESSGLFVNCLIPSFITLGIAQCLNKFTMPKGTNMASCWADSSLIERATELYSNSKSDDKVKDTLKEILKSIEGFDGKNKVSYGTALTETELEGYSAELKNLTVSSKDKKELHKSIKKLSSEIVKKTHVFENIKVTGGSEPVKALNVTSLLEDSVKYFKEFQKTGADTDIKTFAQKSKRLVKSKSVLALAVVLPLAASMQYINRWVTGKVSGVKGAPIYDDFGKNCCGIYDAKSKEGLLKQKFIAISSMIGVSILSMMKIPSWNMFEFKGIFPTMDQARIISTTTFCSRMAVADDSNELAESKWRDIATFCGLYFFGDYAAKGAATVIQNKTGVQLLNETKPSDKNANIFKRFWHWVKDVNIKSSEEVVSKTAQELKEKGLTPDKEQAAKIEKELKHAVNLRSACQLTNLGVSLLLLGLIIPIFTRRSTKKKHAEALKQAREHSPQKVDKRDNPEPLVTPLNIEYSRLKAGFGV